MVRLMRHSAALLDAQKPWVNASEVIAYHSSSFERRYKASDRAAAEAAAMSFASAVLRLVAACMEDEPKRNGHKAVALVECPTCHRRVGHNGHGYPVPHKDPVTNTRCVSGTPRAGGETDDA
jgi:hypothetical protein